MKSQWTIQLTLLITFSTAALGTQAVDLDWSAAIYKTESVFQDLDTDNAPGCALGVIHKGEYLFTKGYGLANLEYGIPITENTVFRVASVTKQFTATAIAILARQDLIDLDADIHTYLPDLRDYSHKVTVRQLVHHIGGIPDYEEYGDPFLNAVGEDFRFGNQDYYTPEEFYRVAKTLPLEVEPETKFIYSNTGYVFLAEIIKRITGMSLKDYAQQEIFAPLGMDDTFIMANTNAIVPNRAYGYKNLGEGTYEISITNFDSSQGDGAMHTTLNDFIKWDRNFYSNRLNDSDPTLIELLNTPPPYFDDVPNVDTFATGEFSPYAWGQFIMEHRGLKMIGHTGGWLGYRSYYLRFPTIELSFVTMCNEDRRSRTAPRINAIRDAYLDVLGVETQ